MIFKDILKNVFIYIDFTTLKILKNSELIFGEKGTFIINPQFYWRGNEADKQHVIDEIKNKYKTQ